jgi:hypothetical protein
MRLSSSAVALGGVRAQVVIVAFVAVAFVATATIGSRLSASLRQVHMLVRTAAVDAPGAAVPAPPAADEPARTVPPATSPLPVVGDEPDAREPAPRFDVEETVRDAAASDANVAELLNDPDPAIGAAVRDFVQSIEPPGGR